MERLPIEIQELIWRKSFDMCLKDINKAYQVRCERLKGKQDLYRHIYVKAYRHDGKYQISCSPTRADSNLNELNDVVLRFCERYAIIGIEPMLSGSYIHFVDRLNYYQDKYKSDPNLIHYKMPKALSHND